jgi:hypothetical protein
MVGTTKLLLGGTSDGKFALARYNADGTLDTTFSGDGKLTTQLGNEPLTTDGDADAEFAIQLTGVRQLTSADVVL